MLDYIVFGSVGLIVCIICVLKYKVYLLKKKLHNEFVKVVELKERLEQERQENIEIEVEEEE